MENSLYKINKKKNSYLEDFFHLKKNNNKFVQSNNNKYMLLWGYCMEK